jgi:hypothetical protein
MRRSALQALCWTFALLWCLKDQHYFSSVPASESNQASIPIPSSELTTETFEPTEAFEPALAATNEMEYETAWAFQLRVLVENEQKFWWILAFLVSIVIGIPTCLMKYRHARQAQSHRGDETKQGERLSLGLKPTEAFAEDFNERRVLLQNELKSGKRMMGMEHEGYSAFQNETDSQVQKREYSVETIAKMVHNFRAKFQNELNSVESLLDEEEYPSNSQKEARSENFKTGRLSSVPKAKRAGDTTPMESRIEMKKGKRVSNVTSRATGDKKKKGKNNVRMSVAPPSNLMAMMAKDLSQTNTIHRTGESRARSVTRKLPEAGVKQSTGQSQHMKVVRDSRRRRQ